MQIARVGLTMVVLVAGQLYAQTLPLPGRAPNARSGSTFTCDIEQLPLPDREQAIEKEILSGNVPDFLRRLSTVTVSKLTNVARFYVTPDYLAVGGNDDYVRLPLTPSTAQSIADRLGCTLPTPKMVDAIYAAAEVKLAPSPITPSPAMTTVPLFVQHNDTVRAQRSVHLNLHPPGTLVAGHKKDVVLTTRLSGTTNKVAIYGWHQTNGTPIQPLYLGHTATWVDYSHGIRLIQQSMLLNGETTTVDRVLSDPKLAHLLSDEGAITNAYVAATNVSHFGERTTTFTFDPEVRIQINAPSDFDVPPARPVLLILFALPNGNTIEQTAGKQLQPGDDWHFDIQHIGAQTRFLRSVLTNRTIVIAYLEAGMKSWPAWRRKHGDPAIPEIIARIQSEVSTNNLEIVLTGHSGGGSFTFGYLNQVEQIPDNVVRIAFLDSNYAYETTNHFAKLAGWLESSSAHTLCVLAYHDSIALLNGKTFVSERGGTWGRSHAMLTDFSGRYSFTSRTNAGLQSHIALDGRLQLLLKENPDRKILHTVQVERNGFLHAMLISTPMEGQGYNYFGERAYSSWITP